MTVPWTSVGLRVYSSDSALDLSGFESLFQFQNPRPQWVLELIQVKVYLTSVSFTVYSSDSALDLSWFESLF